MMYQWRKLTKEEQKATLALRREEHRPWHSPRHIDYGAGCYLITGTCYEHKPVIGAKTGRMRECAAALDLLVSTSGSETIAWCVLPNHYHYLVYTESVLNILELLKLFHGRAARKWNLEDNQRGRKVFYNYLERYIPSEERFRKTINYVHHNPVKHGYVDRWDIWEMSSAQAYITAVGDEQARRWWLEYPIGDFGAGWDD